MRPVLRQALGTAVFFGMLGVTMFGLLFTPVFYAPSSGPEDLEKMQTPVPSG
jgi:multidrug efflux pump subunit AcrB